MTEDKIHNDALLYRLAASVRSSSNDGNQFVGPEKAYGHMHIKGALEKLSDWTSLRSVGASF